MLPLLVDTFEPVGDILPLLQQSIPAESSHLNLQGFADYLWNAFDSHTIQAERKQNGELLSSIMEVEAQLRRQYNKADENILITEGFITPTPTGCLTWKRSKNGKLFVPDHKYEQFYSGLLSWYYQLDKAGITCYTTPDLLGTAMLLVALYKNSQEEVHTTLQRYIKSKIVLKKHNSHVKTLMGLVGAGLGETKAKALIDMYGSPWGVFIQSVETLQEVEGIGPVLAKKILGSIGREG